MQFSPDTIPPENYDPLIVGPNFQEESIEMLKLYRDYLRRQLGKFIKDEKGAALLEYTVLLVIIMGGAIALIILAGGWVSNEWQGLMDTLNNT